MTAPFKTKQERKEEEPETTSEQTREVRNYKNTGDEIQKTNTNPPLNEESKDSAVEIKEPVKQGNTLRNETEVLVSENPEPIVKSKEPITKVLVPVSESKKESAHSDQVQNQRGISQSEYQNVQKTETGNTGKSVLKTGFRTISEPAEEKTKKNFQTLPRRPTEKASEDYSRSAQSENETPLSENSIASSNLTPTAKDTASFNDDNNIIVYYSLPESITTNTERETTVSENIRDKTINSSGDLRPEPGTSYFTDDNSLEIEENEEILPSLEDYRAPENKYTDRNATVYQTSKNPEIEKLYYDTSNDNLNISSISIMGLSARNNGKYAETDIARNTDALRISFRIDSNEITTAGHKKVYTVIKNPKHKIINQTGSFTTLEGKQMPFTDMTSVHYDNKSMNVVLFIDEIIQKFVKGTYIVEIYVEGKLIETSFLILN